MVCGVRKELSAVTTKHANVRKQKYIQLQIMHSSGGGGGGGGWGEGSRSEKGDAFDHCYILLYSYLWFDDFVVIVLSDEPRQNQGRGLVDRKLVQPPQVPSYIF